MRSAARSSSVGGLEALGDELVALDLDDPQACELARREARDSLPTLVTQIDDAVDLRCLPGGARFPRERGIFAHAVDQHVVHGPRQLRLSLPRDRVLTLLHDRRPL